MPLGEGGPDEREGEREAPPLRKRYFTVIGCSNVKMVAHRHAAYRNKHWQRAS